MEITKQTAEETERLTRLKGIERSPGILSQALAQAAVDRARRFFLDQDADGHWFVVPVDKRAEWQNWTNLSRDNPHAAYAPTFAREVGGNPSMVTFTDPLIS